MRAMANHPQRVWPLQGATNFRDLGGYPGHGGRPVRWRRLFRSDHLAGLTDADKSLLAGLGLARAFDFRGQAERAADALRAAGRDPALAGHRADGGAAHAGPGGRPASALTRRAAAG